MEKNSINESTNFISKRFLNVKNQRNRIIKKKKWINDWLSWRNRLKNKKNLENSSINGRRHPFNKWQRRKFKVKNIKINEFVK